MKLRPTQFLVLLVLWLATGSVPAALAEPQAQAGPYRIELTTDPGVITVGRPTKLLLKITDGSGKPIEGAQVKAIAQMPGMAMGEHEEQALPQAGQPGLYSAPAQFGMEGAYTASVRITGSLGDATASIPLQTGQNTAAQTNGTTATLFGFLPWLIGGLLLVFVLYRVRSTGQRANIGALSNWRIWFGLLLIIAAYLGSQWAVRKYTKPGHMSVLEAQGADMTGMKPPVGAVPVAAMAVRRQPMDATVTYTGSAVSFVDQDVSARVPGTIVWMPAYPGMAVHRGQMLARLDPRELVSKVDEQSAAAAMSQHATAIARIQYRQALGTKAQARAQVEGARNDVATAQSELVSARQDVTAAEDERASAQADLEGAQAGAEDAQAQLTSAQADQTYWSTQLKRSQELLKSGSISQQEFQQDQNQAANANAKVVQAGARIQQVNSAIRGAQGRVKKADAMVASAQARVVGAQTKVQGSQSKVQQMQASADALTAAADAAHHEIAHTQAGEQQTEAQLATARVVAGYTEIKADIDGVVTQRLISPGTLVQPGQPIVKISQISPLRLQANVAESDLPNIRIGNRVRVSTLKDPNHPVLARVTALFPETDPSSRTSLVEAIVPNTDHHFLPGDYLTMDITTGENRNALAVPASALISQPKATSPTLATEATQAVWVITAGQPEKTIYTCTMHPEVKQDHPGDCPKCKMPLTPQAVGGKWRAHLVPVTTGMVNEKYVEIRSGLAEGDQVIYAGYEGLHEGDPVVPTEWGSSGPLALPPASGEVTVGTIYTCPMHPEVKQDHPGDCPKCGMRLIPMASGGSAGRMSGIGVTQ